VDRERWEKIMALRDRVLKEIETARAAKRIGDSLEADVEFVAPAGEDEKLLRESGELFKTILVIANLDVKAGKEERISVRKAGGRKCPRCWNWVAAAPAPGAYPELCPRCAAAVAAAAKE
jgi:isoleucyl-tRNA synthetase